MKKCRAALACAAKTGWYNNTKQQPHPDAECVEQDMNTLLSEVAWNC